MELSTEDQRPPTEARPESQVRIQFTTKLRDLTLAGDTGPILVPTSESIETTSGVLICLTLSGAATQIYEDMGCRRW